jgi:hypothetical protein
MDFLRSYFFKNEPLISLTFLGHFFHQNYFKRCPVDRGPIKKVPIKRGHITYIICIKVGYLFNKSNIRSIYNFFSLTRKIKASGASRQVEAMKHSPYDEDHEPVPGTNLHTTSGMLEKEL